MIGKFIKEYKFQRAMVKVGLSEGYPLLEAIKYTYYKWKYPLGYSLRNPKAEDAYDHPLNVKRRNDAARARETL